MVEAIIIGAVVGAITGGIITIAVAIFRFIFIRREVPTGGWVDSSKCKTTEGKNEFMIPLTPKNIRKIIQIRDASN